MFVADLPLDEGVVKAEVLEEIGDVGPAQGMDVQSGQIAELIDVVAEAAVQVELGNRQSVGGGEDFRHHRGEPWQPGPDPGGQNVGGLVKGRHTERLLDGELRWALPYRTCSTPNSTNGSARRFREKFTVCRCVTSLARKPQA